MQKDVPKLSNIPVHIAVIPDGNRRWARSHELNAWEGHREGSKNLKEILDVALKMKIKFFSFWGASLDNVDKRPKTEVIFLLNLFKKEFLGISKDKMIHENKVRVNVLGKWREKFPGTVCQSIEKAIDATKEYSDFFLNFFLAYNGTDEMLEAIKGIVKRTRNNQDLEVTPELIKSELFSADLPPVDYIIRTGGEPHNSVGFMMWDSANAQYYFTEKVFPDFHGEDFADAITEYDRRERRFGK